MKILAMGAHPDDIEIFMYGLVSIFKEKGNQVFTIIATDGAKGGSLPDDLLIKKREEETIGGLKKISAPIFLNIPDSELGYDPIHKKIIKEKILNIMPDLIITHSKYDYHADHRSLSLLTTNAVSHYIPILYCDTLMGVNFQPNYYIDITDHFEMKKEAVLKHNTQNPQRFVDLCKLMNGYRAAQCNAPRGKYAEAYSFTSSFPFSDIREMLPSSPKLRPFHIDNQNGFL
ncbi:PIG-L family deacetylase [Alphaproteobacteria bacterium]|nr:PIG-L family deacetylase [Alphaproteobacteria bacterium]MDC1023066.1 PIG-L family deacetylase [Alphaproteobacteria bacterium]